MMNLGLHHNQNDAAAEPFPLGYEAERVGAATRNEWTGRRSPLIPFAGGASSTPPANASSRVFPRARLLAPITSQSRSHIGLSNSPVEPRFVAGAQAIELDRVETSHDRKRPRPLRMVFRTHHNCPSRRTRLSDAGNMPELILGFTLHNGAIAQ